MLDFGSDFGIFIDTDDFAQKATIGIESDISCIFDHESELVSADGTEIRGYAPILIVYDGDLSYSPNDELVSNITNTADSSVWPHDYRVIDIENDGTGMLTLILREEN